MTPNRENIQKWVDALRSGDYKQGEGALVSGSDSDKHYCCLGVACAIAANEGIVSYDGSGGYNRHGEYEDYSDHSDTELPEVVKVWLGVNAVDPLIATSGEGVEERIHAINANDSLGWSFEQIASAVERTYLGSESNE